MKLLHVLLDLVVHDTFLRTAPPAQTHHIIVQELDE